MLHELGKKPYIKSFGKVATVSSIDVFRDFSSANKLSFLEITFGGGLYTNLTRLFSYGFIFLFLMIGLIVSSEKLDSIKEKRRKVRLLKTFKEYDSDKVTDKDSFFFDYYLNHDAEVVRKYHSIMKSESRLSYLSNESEASKEKLRSIRWLRKSEKEMLEELKNEGFVTIKDRAVIVDEQRFSVLTDFVNYLKRKGEFKRSHNFYPEDFSDLKESEFADEVGESNA